MSLPRDAIPSIIIQQRQHRLNGCMCMSLPAAAQSGWSALCPRSKCTACRICSTLVEAINAEKRCSTWSRLLFFWTDPAPPASRRSSSTIPFPSSIADCLSRRIMDIDRLSGGSSSSSVGEQSAILSRKPFCSVRCLPAPLRCLLHRSVCVCPGHTLRGGKRNTTQPARSSLHSFTHTSIRVHVRTHVYTLSYRLGLWTCESTRELFHRKILSSK